jgi:hypothetical protein
MLSLGTGAEFDSQNIMSPSIIKEGGRYYLFYAGGPLGPRNGGELIKYQIGLALSNDGETWKNYGDGHAEEATTARGTLVRRRVAHSPRSSLLQAAQRSPRKRPL